MGTICLLELVLPTWYHEDVSDYLRSHKVNFFSNDSNESKGRKFGPCRTGRKGKLGCDVVCRRCCPMPLGEQLFSWIEIDLELKAHGINATAE